MDRCEICGRQPAKRMTFKAHQGFILFRRELEIAGVFCRDHAIDAYLASRKKTLSGMWFSPDAIVFGALRSIVDSVKLLDLPAEVKDAPWTFHRVACPNCKCAHFSTAGAAECKKCRRTFAILSCATCGSVHAVPHSGAPDELSLNCRRCNRLSAAPLPAQNWPALLIACALAEAGALVANADAFVDPREREIFASTLRELFPFKANTITWLEEYFERLDTLQESRLLRACIANCDQEILLVVLSFAATVARADGYISNEELVVLRGLAGSIGADAEEFFGQGGEFQRTTAANSTPWWTVLCVEQSATREEIDISYGKLARKFHPDLANSAPPAEKAAADLRMKEINRAYAEACIAASYRPAANTQKKKPPATGEPKTKDQDYRGGNTKHGRKQGSPSTQSDKVACAEKPSGPNETSAASKDEPKSPVGSERQRNETADANSGNRQTSPGSLRQDASRRGNSEKRRFPRAVVVLALLASPLFLGTLLLYLARLHSGVLLQPNIADPKDSNGSASLDSPVASHPNPDTQDDENDHTYASAVENRSASQAPLQSTDAKSFGKRPSGLSQHHTPADDDHRRFMALYERASRRVDEGDFEGAESDLKVLVHLEPTNAECYRCRAMAHAFFDDFLSASSV